MTFINHLGEVHKENISQKNLTKREIEIIGIANGLTNNEIALLKSSGSNKKS